MLVNMNNNLKKLFKIKCVLERKRGYCNILYHFCNLKILVTVVLTLVALMTSAIICSKAIVCSTSFWWSLAIFSANLRGFVELLELMVVGCRVLSDVQLCLDNNDQQ